MWSFVAVALGVAGPGCQATSPAVDAPDLSEFDAGGAFADTVISFGDINDQTNCTETLPACSDAPADCGPLDVLGAPDATAYVLPAYGRIEVAFRCSQITEKGASGDEVSYDFQILATVDGGEAVVEVSLDGSSYVTVQPLTTTDQTFDLARAGIDVVRFIRISDTGGGGIAIDAISDL